MPTTQAKHWCYTINNYTDDDVKRLSERREDVTYHIFGYEMGDSGTKHLQGFISFRKRKSFGPTKEILGGKAHLEPAKGTPAQAAEYCKKDGDYVEYGELPGGKGSRTDLREVAEKIKNGVSFRSIAEDHPTTVLRYGSGVLRLKNFYRPKNREAPEIHVFWGPTGSGKTKRVWEFTKHDELWVHPGDRWFDGYDGHLAVLFDDFDGGWFKLTYLLKLLDRYIFQVPVKGGYVWWYPKQIYITSNLHPKDWYNNTNKEHVSALLRRLNEFGEIIKIG